TMSNEMMIVKLLDLPYREKSHYQKMSKRSFVHTRQNYFQEKLASFLCRLPKNDYVEMVKGLLNFIPEERWSIDQALTSTFFNQPIPRQPSTTLWFNSLPKLSVACLSSSNMFDRSKIHYKTRPPSAFFSRSPISGILA